MILESRSIIFSDEELVLAMRPVLEGRGMNINLPIRDIVSELDGDGEVTVRFVLSDGTNPIQFTSREVGAAVLNHCIERGIPLPRGAYKELGIRGDHVALIVRMESGIHANVDEDE
ncbi:MAG: hypothetical protein EP335_01725 [Alphaproteobacteria bacterium]|nr:MAG: hypothetical protein EP335_01725 [Alphaproteobacteria bacterium]